MFQIPILSLITPANSQAQSDRDGFPLAQPLMPPGVKTCAVAKMGEYRFLRGMPAQSRIPGPTTFQTLAYGLFDSYHCGLGKNKGAHMLTTSPSLLLRFRQGVVENEQGAGPPNHEAWGRFVSLYTPFLMSVLLHRLKMREEDAEDVLQQIFLRLLKVLPKFTYDTKAGKFRSYLREVCRTQFINWRKKHKLQHQLAGDGDLSGLEDSSAELARVWNEDHDRFLVRRARELMEAEFQPKTWKACWEFIYKGRPAKEVADEFGITENAVFLAKYRVTRRVKEELAGLLDN